MGFIRLPLLDLTILFFGVWWERLTSFLDMLGLQLGQMLIDCLSCNIRRSTEQHIRCSLQLYLCLGGHPYKESLGVVLWPIVVAECGLFWWLYLLGWWCGLDLW